MFSINLFCTKRFSFLSAATILLFIGLYSCKNENNQGQQAASDTVVAPPAQSMPVFNADSAYAYVDSQVALGPRTPGSEAQLKCAAWMQSRLRDFCDTVYRQNTVVTGGDHKKLRCINLIGAIHPAAKRRVLLLAHWDSRPWADEDVKAKDQPILAADDGGSGVGVLLELARDLKSNPLPADLGVDILFTDVEDYGRTEWNDDSYCLGTQYWVRHPHVPGYHADFGILLDMVGAKNARFPMEASSAQFAPDVQAEVWKAASRAGFSSYFPPVPSRGGVTDDHVYVNELAHIPTIDIISLSDTTTSGFAAHWHTHSDSMDLIDRNTLKAVGQTLLQVLFETASPA